MSTYIDDHVFSCLTVNLNFICAASYFLTSPFFFLKDLFFGLSVSLISFASYIAPPRHLPL